MAKRYFRIMLYSFICLSVTFALTALFGTFNVHATVTPDFSDSTLEFKADSTSADREIYFEEPNIRITSSDQSVFKVYYDDETSAKANSSYYWLAPVGPGTATLRAENEFDSSDYWEKEITIGSDFFAGVLENGYFGQGGWYDDEDWFYVEGKVNYGSTYMLVKMPIEAEATVFVNGKDVSAVHSNLPDLEVQRFTGHTFLEKIGSEIVINIEWGGASKDFTAKIVSASKVRPLKVKPGSRKGKVALKKVHKGDYLKIKVGKKFIKSIKITKNASNKTVTFNAGKKLKKGTKIKYYLYNKHKQKLSSATRVVGK
jgi:hypothetical protein